MKRNTKLVRDGIPKNLHEKGVPYEQRTAEGEEYVHALIKKLEEEIGEFTSEASVEELADIIEVIEALRKLPKYKDVESVRQKKASERGAFDAKIILTGDKYK